MEEVETIAQPVSVPSLNTREASVAKVINSQSPETKTCNLKQYETTSLTTVELPTIPEPQTSYKAKTEVRSFVAAIQRETTSPEVCNTLEVDSILSKKPVHGKSLPVVCNTSEYEADLQITQKDLQNTSVDEDTENSLPSDMRSASSWSPLAFHNRADHRASPLASFNSPVTESCWLGGGDSATVATEGLSLGQTDSADSLARSVQNIIEPENRQEAVFNSASSWLGNAVRRDEIWTSPAEVKDIWSTSTADRSDLLTGCAEQKHTVQNSVGEFGDGKSLTAASVASKHFTVHTDKTGFNDQQDIWPTAFGPFAMPSQSTGDSVCRLPPGLETQVLTRVGVIGQRGPQISKSAAGEGYDSGVDSVNDDNLGPVSSFSSDDLASASETAVSDLLSVESLLRAAVEQQPTVTAQEPIIANDNVFSSSPLLTDIISSLITQSASHQENPPILPDVSNSAPERPDSCDYMSAAAAAFEDNISVESTVKQTASTLCEEETSEHASDAGDETVCTDNALLLRDIISQLLDMLSKPQELRFADICTALYAKLSASTSAVHLSEDAGIAGISNVVGSSTDPSTSVACGHFLGSRKVETSSVDEDTAIGGATTCEVVTSSTVLDPSDLQSPINNSASLGSIDTDDTKSGKVAGVVLPISKSNTCSTGDGTITSVTGHTPTVLHTHPTRGSSSASGNMHAANTQTEGRLTDGKADLSLPVTVTNKVSVSSGTATAADPRASSLADKQSLRSHDTAALQQVLSKVAISPVKATGKLNNDSYNRAEKPATMNDLLALLQRWKL